MNGLGFREMGEAGCLIYGGKGGDGTDDQIKIGCGIQRLKKGHAKAVPAPFPCRVVCQPMGRLCGPGTGMGSCRATHGQGGHRG